MCDAEVSLDELTAEFWGWLSRCGPFGMGNREPVFVSRRIKLTSPVRPIKERHVCLQLQSESGTSKFSALGWSRGAEWIERCSRLGLQAGSRVDVAYRLKEKANPQYGGLELELVDLTLSLH